jgi:nucleotide-binding universal stress UspA family protein
VFDHLLLPVDDTDESRHAQALAVHLAAASGATVHALYVRDDGSLPATDAEVSPAALVDEALRESAASALAGARTACEATGVDVTETVVTGHPVEVILDHAEAVGADLVVLGAHGRGRLARFLRRPVAAEVARRSPVPVLTVPGAAPADGVRLRRLLVATDGSESARRARALALGLAATFDARVDALYVVERRFGRSGPLRDLLDRQAEAVGRATRAAAARAGVEAAVETRVGRPAPAILDAADERSADLIVLGTHGRTGLDRLAMGSVAAAVARDADRPVLTVPATGDDPESGDS